MDDLLEKAIELLNDDQLTNEYPSDWSIKLAQALATVAIARELKTLNKTLKRMVTDSGELEVRIVGSVTTYNGGSL